MHEDDNVSYISAALFNQTTTQLCWPNENIHYLKVNNTRMSYSCTYYLYTLHTKTNFLKPGKYEITCTAIIN